MAPHSSTLAWKFSWMEEPGWLQSMGSRRVGHDWATSLLTFHFHALEKEMATHSSVLAWRIPGMGEPGGLPSMGSHRVGHDWSDLAAAAVSHLAYYPQGSSMLSQMQDFLLLYGWILFQCIKVKVKSLSRVQLFVTPWTAAHQAPPPMGFSRQEYWSGAPKLQQLRW